MAADEDAERAPAVVTARTVATLLLLSAALPLNLAVTALALLRSAWAPAPVAPAPDPDGPRTVLLSGGKMTKALALARAFHRAGCRVILVESPTYRWTGHRFSRAVDRFYTVPAPQDAGYAAALVEIVRREHVDVYVPVCSPAAARHDAEAMAVLSEHCAVLHFDPPTLARLDDKYAFSVAASRAGLPVPECHRITDPQQVLDFDFAAGGKRYVLKSIPYDPVRRLDLTPLPRPTPRETAAFVAALPISEQRPWILQEFIAGQEYCTHSTVRDGQVQLHCCCESSSFQLNYAMVDKPEIESWAREFASALGLTGQMSLDFIQAPDGTAYAIECNPRTHSAITMFYNHPQVARAYLESGVPTVFPRADSRPTYWLYHELGRLVLAPTRWAETARTIARGTDAIFDWNDPLPFLMVHHAQIPSLLIDNLRHRRPWIRIDFNIGKLVQPAGD